MDAVNGLFELLASFFIGLHIRRTRFDKAVKGVSIPATGFFFSWGVWNLFYYPHLGQTWSFYAGILVMLTNLVLIISLLYFARKPA